ncbi:hypothetical protein H5410_062763 [Solanum commersonii]|uniref:Uncharacterized protein n=1 Tax=Solanum commersonii TaxID=4109 RepID=A0A9J5WBV0_SOLCO|nr:hypothetical protein H5410_062763 [Solanum commersonii]
MAMVQNLEGMWDTLWSVALEVNKINALRRRLSIRVQHLAFNLVNGEDNCSSDVRNLRWVRSTAKFLADDSSFLNRFFYPFCCF